MSGEDLYDVARTPWCVLCNAAHEACEVDEFGFEVEWDEDEGRDRD